MKTDAADNETFFALTPELVLAAAEQAGLSPSGHVWALNSLENRVYDLRLEDGSHVVAKFYRPGRWSRTQLQEEHSFLAELREADIPVCVPMPFSDGSTLHEQAGIFFAVWPRTGGRAPDELNPEQADILGRLIGRLHMVGRARLAPTRPTISAATYVREPLAFLLEAGVLPAHCEERYANAALALADHYEQLSEGVPLQRIHGDCHLGNILCGQEGWFLLDFDDFAIGPAVQDVWMLLGRDGQDTSSLRSAFLAGYRSFADLPDHWLKLGEVLRGMRYIHYSAWVARRFRDPAFPNAFPHFGTVGYWEQETADLEEQLGVARGKEPPAPGGAREQTAEPELTNSDFFWDMEE